MMLFGAVLMLAFVPVFPGAGTSPRWVVLSLAVPAILLFSQTFPRPPLLLAAFLAFVWASLFWAPHFAEALNMAWRLSLFGAIVLLGMTHPLKPFLVGLALGMIPHAVLVLAQLGGYDGVPQTIPPGGLFVNKNFGGEAAALVLAGVVLYRLWWLVPAPLIAVGASSSKAALLALGIGAIFAVPAQWRKYAIGGALVCALLYGAAAVYAGTAPAHVDHLMQRINLWRDIIDNATLFGHGAGAFYGMENAIVRYSTIPVAFEYAHNDVLQLVFEFGLGSLFLIALAGLAFLRSRCKVAATILLLFAVEGCFGFPLYLPVTMAIGAFCLGRLLQRGGFVRGGGAFREFELRRRRAHT